MLWAMCGGGCAVVLLCLVQHYAFDLQAACPTLSGKFAPIAFLAWLMAPLFPACWPPALAVGLAATVFGLLLIDWCSVLRAALAQRKLAAKAKAKLDKARASKTRRAAKREAGKAAAKDATPADATTTPPASTPADTTTTSPTSTSKPAGDEHANNSSTTSPSQRSPTG